MLRSVIFGVAMMASIDGAQAEEAFVGRWAIDPAGCTVDGDTSATAPLYATPTSLKWFVAQCKIGKMYKIGQTFHIEGRCSNEGKIVSTPIRLEPRGDLMRVTWNGTKIPDMRRCK